MLYWYCEFQLENYRKMKNENLYQYANGDINFDTFKRTRNFYDSMIRTFNLIQANYLNLTKNT